jgi:hypothetical protein
MAKSNVKRTYVLLGTLGFIALLGAVYWRARAPTANAKSVLFQRIVVESPPKKAEFVVGVVKAALYADPHTQNPRGYLELGTEVEVKEVREEVVKVNVGSLPGWLRRCTLCSVAELAKRRADDRVPEKTACVGYDVQHFLYGGSLPSQEGHLHLEPGCGLWLDSSTNAKPLVLAGGSQLTAEANQLFYRGADGAIVALPILPYTPTLPQLAADMARHKAVQEKAAHLLVAREQAVAHEAARRQAERELLVLRLLRPKGNVRVHGRTAGLSDLQLLSLLRDAHVAHEWLENLKPEHALIPLPDCVREIGRNPYIESVVMSVGGNVPLSTVKQILGEEAKPEAATEASATETLLLSPNGPVAVAPTPGVTWHRYGWLEFAMGPHAVAAIRVLPRRVPDAVPGVRVHAPPELPSEKTIITTEKAPPKPTPGKAR